MNPGTATRLNFSSGFSMKVATINAMGVLAALATPILVDPQLTSHVAYGARHYPHALWALLCCPAVFAGTYIPLRYSKKTTWGLFASFLALAVFGAVGSLSFPPEWPHMGVLAPSFFYSLVSVGTVFLRLKRHEYSIPEGGSIQVEAKLELLKLTISVWQAIAIGLGLAYLGAIFVAMETFNASFDAQVTKEDELFLLINANSIQMSVFSVVFLLGPLYESIRATFEPLKQCLNLKK